MRPLTNALLISLTTAILCFTGCNQKAGTIQEPFAKTSSGEISGSYNDGVYAFKGIPYASAERFMPPKDPDVWEGILACNDFGPVARQIVPWYPDSVQDEKALFSVKIGRAHV